VVQRAGKGELVEKSNMQKMHIANSDKPVAFYSLDVIIWCRDVPCNQQRLEDDDQQRRAG